MKRAWGVVIIAVAAMSSTGCGTLFNFVGAAVPTDEEKKFPMVYGGVQLDAAFLGSGVSGSGDGKGAAILLGLELADFPASLVGDTLTLPLVYGIYQLRGSHRHDEDIDDPSQPDQQPEPPPDLGNPDRLIEVPNNDSNVPGEGSHESPGMPPLPESTSAEVEDVLPGTLKWYSQPPLELDLKGSDWQADAGTNLLSFDGAVQKAQALPRIVEATWLPSELVHVVEFGPLRSAPKLTETEASEFTLPAVSIPVP